MGVRGVGLIRSPGGVRRLETAASFISFFQDLQHLGDLLVVYVLDLLQAARNSEELLQVDVGPIRFPGSSACILEGIDDRLAWAFFRCAFQQALQDDRMDQIEPVGSENDKSPQYDERQQEDRYSGPLHRSSPPSVTTSSKFRSNCRSPVRFHFSWRVQEWSRERESGTTSATIVTFWYGHGHRDA